MNRKLALRLSRARYKCSISSSRRNRKSGYRRKTRPRIRRMTRRIVSWVQIPMNSKTCNTSTDLALSSRRKGRTMGSRLSDSTSKLLSRTCSAIRQAISVTFSHNRWFTSTRRGSFRSSHLKRNYHPYLRARNMHFWLTSQAHSSILSSSNSQKKLQVLSQKGTESSRSLKR